MIFYWIGVGLSLVRSSLVAWLVVADCQKSEQSRAVNFAPQKCVVYAQQFHFGREGHSRLLSKRESFRRVFCTEKVRSVDIEMLINKTAI